MYFILSLLLIGIGSLMVVSPQTWFNLTERWKSYSSLLPRINTYGTPALAALCALQLEFCTLWLHYFCDCKQAKLNHSADTSLRSKLKNGAAEAAPFFCLQKETCYCKAISAISNAKCQETHTLPPFFMLSNIKIL